MSTMDTWQAWYEEFVRDSSPEGFVAHVRLNDAEQVSDSMWATAFHVRNLFRQANAMLLACLQEPPAAAVQAIATIAKAWRSVSFGRAPRSLKKHLKEVFRSSARELEPYYVPEADVFASLFLRYLRDDYAPEADANLLMQAARFEMARGRSAPALALAGEAGALVLRGSPLWDGWALEGEGQFPFWARGLVALASDWGRIGLLPLGALSEERARAAARAETLARAYAAGPGGLELAAGAPANAEAAPELDLAFVEQWVELAGREEPMDPGEIAGLGELYERACEMSVRVLEASILDVAQVPPEEMVRLAAASIGVLRYAQGPAIELLIGIVRDEERGLEPETIDEALWSLEQLGAAALPAVFDFVRYSGNDEAREDLLDVLGVVGRGSPEVFDYLAGKFLGLSWRDDKLLYVLPLARLGDARAMPMLCDALSDPAIDEDAVWELLDGLEELEVGFSVDISNGNVMIPDYGLIEDVAPPDWLPRAERDAEVDAELEPLVPAEAAWQSTEDDEVVFDAFGIPHCVDCGAVMHRANGRWEHPFDADEFPIPQKPLRAEAVGRNDPCPCGSGKKYKHCHGRPDAARVN